MDKVNEFEYGVDRQTTSKQRFSDEANLHYRYSLDEDLAEDKDTIMDYVRHHMRNQRPRLDELRRYYEGENVRILEEKRRKEENSADHRAVHNIAGYISTFIQGYMSGVPIKTEYPEPVEESGEAAEIPIGTDKQTMNDVLQELNRKNDADEHNSELVLDQSIYGRAYELVYRRKDDLIRFVRLDPTQTFVVYSDDVEREPAGAIRYKKSFNDETKLKVWVYTNTRIVTYEFDLKKNTELVELSSETHSFGQVPIVEYENNSSRRGDFEAVLNLIDLYDSAQSDTANYTQDLNDAMLKIEGNVKMDAKEAKEMKANNIIIARPAVDPNGNVHQPHVDYIYKQYDVAGAEAYKTRILNDIFLISCVPNLLDDQFSGNKSGEALKMKLFGLSQKRATKERKFKKSLRQRYRLIKSIMNVASEGDFEVEKIIVTFTENLPRAISQEVEWFTKAGGQLSLQTLLTLLSFVENPQEEMDKMDAERERNAPQQNQLDFQGLLNYVNEDDPQREGVDDADNEPEQAN